MCGIVGFLGLGDKGNLLDMMAALHHRGPDDGGTYIENVKTKYQNSKFQPNVGLGHCRLAIIDLETGHQPMHNEDKAIWIICNGEIYNFKDLRKSLEKKGHSFYTKSDTEVIIHLYEDHGTDAFEKLNGMFAFALWDNKRQKLYLARDKMGQKPLYYTCIRGTFIFASDANAILKNPLFEKRLNLKSVAKFLFYEHVPTPDCIWENVAQLLPASYLVFDPLKPDYKINRYWKITYLPLLNLKKEEDYLGALEEKLIQAIKRHLVADVPVGVYLSGGMDSTTIAYYSQRILNGALKTFTIAFKESTFDEQHKAKETAERLGTRHTEIDFNAQDFMKATFEIVPRLDVPFADSSLIPAYFLNKSARNHIKVALGGEGGDEIFVGYPIYRAHELLKYLRAIPKGIRKRIIIPFINSIHSSYKNETWEYKLKKFIEAEDYLDNPYYCQQIWLGAFGPDRLLKLFKKEFHEKIGIGDLFENIDLYRLDADANEGLIDGLMRQTQHKYLMDDGLTKADRASMANSLETRAPLLDNELMEWVNRVPFRYKYKRGMTKLILKNLMHDKIPEEIIYGHKRGFTPPIAQWFVTDFQNKIKDYILSKDSFFNMDYIERLWQEHFSHRQNHRKLLWTLFVWKLWNNGYA